MQRTVVNPLLQNSGKKWILNDLKMCLIAALYSNRVSADPECVRCADAFCAARALYD